MNESIELHDSKLTAVSISGGEAVVSLSPAYIHRSTGSPGVDTGSGWLQRATITLNGASVVSTPTELPATIADGFLRIATVQHDNVIPASGSFTGIIELSIVLATGETLIIHGERTAIELHGEPSFVEDFNR